MAPSTSLPVLDMSSYLSAPNGALGKRFVGDLLAACHGPGFCYLTGHGVPASVDAALFEVMQQFFALEEGARHRLEIANSAAFRGYTVLGDERTNGRSDWRDQLDYGPEQAAPNNPAAVAAWHRLRGPNQWPAELPSMAPNALAWMSAVEQVALAAIRALATGLGLAVDHFDAMFVPDGDVHVKLIRYPAGDADGSVSDQPGQGVGAHSDSGLLTFIAQRGERGLQVQLDGKFVDAPPIPGAYVMNLGEMMQRATNGYLRATPHRVISPAAGEPERLSAALFFNPRFETVFEPIELPPHLAAEAPGHDVGGRDDIQALFGENNLKIRLRSHPDVARRHYADVHP